MRNGQLTIIEVEAREDGGHGLQSQSGRTECWMDGWIAVPSELEDAVWNSGGYCELDIQNGVLVGITPIEKPEPVPTPQEIIMDLKGQLSSTDYQIIKCSEAQLVGEPLPYDIKELHTSRQALRTQINELEATING